MNSKGNVRTQSIDRGLQSYMMSVFNMMAIGLCVTGLVAFLCGNNLVLRRFIYSNPIMPYIVAFAPVVYVLIF